MSGLVRNAAVPAGVVICTLALACTYSDKTAEARQLVAAGQYSAAVQELNRYLKVRKTEQLPTKYKKGIALGVLERATVLHAMGEYELSARDIQAAERELEFLDIAKDTAGKIGKYIYSDSATKYKQPPSERLALNSINMVNYLAQQDLAGAQVEARRFTTMRNYLRDYDPEHAHGVFGSYVAGFVHERLGERDAALLYYDEAAQGAALGALAAPVDRLRNEPSSSRSTELLIIVKVGRVPYKVPRRIPIGAAIGLGAAYITGNTKVLEHTAFKVVTFPDLEPAGNIYDDAIVSVDGQRVPLQLIDDNAIQIRREFDELKPKIIGSAITRMITRAVAAEAARAAGNQAEGDAGAAIGLLAAFAVEGALVALDKPDTRSWTLLPARMYVARIDVPAGAHEVDVDLRGSGQAGERRSYDVEVPQGDFVVVDVTTLR